MAKNVTQICVACGSPLDVPVQGGRVKCPYCGTVNQVEALETKQGDEVICPECGASNPKDAQHCGRCGIKLEINCPKCGAVNPYGTVYCVKCGVDIQGEIKRQKDDLARQQAEQLRVAQQLRQQQVQAKQKRRISSLVSSVVALGILSCLAIVVASWFYNAELSPAARRTQTAVSLAQTTTADYRILLVDDFSDPNSGWGQYTSANGTTSYASGGYLIHVIAKNWLVWDSPTASLPNDVRIEVDATKQSGQDDSSQFGVACRYQDQDNYYLLSISNDGYAVIYKKVAGKYTNLSSTTDQWTKVDGIYGGSETNHLRADCNGTSLSLYANGSQVASASDDTFPGGGVALVAGTFDQGGTDILFNHFAVYRP